MAKRKTYWNGPEPRHKRRGGRRDYWQEDERPHESRGGRVQRHSLALDPTGDPLWYGCCEPLFDLCSSEDITSLFYEDSSAALRWIGMMPAEACRIVENFIQYAAPVGAAAGTPATGIPSNICEPGTGYEFGTCDFELKGFGKLQNSAPPRGIGGQDIPYCVSQKRYRVDGTLIRNQRDWDMQQVLRITMQQLAIRLLVGNKATTNDADGLRQLIKTGYTNTDATPCALMDSYVLDWAGNDMCGPDGADGTTLNGDALGVGQAYYKVLRDIFYRIRRRVELAGMPPLQPGDVAIFQPDWAIPCLIECATCWIECGGDYALMTSEAAASKRAELMNGFNGLPMIEFDGFPIPIMAFNPIDYTTATLRGLMDNADGTFDAFMLTRQMGSQTVLTMEYNDLDDGRERPGYGTNENGQFLVWETYDNRCEQLSMATEWRVKLTAPWAQVSMLNVNCATTFTTSVKPAASRATLNTKDSTCV